jgi:surfeit locus 1 family protein
MLQKLKAAGLIWPTLATLAGVALLLSLGNWQWQRKAWKEGLMADRAARAQAAPVPLLDVLGAGRPGSEFQRVTISGTFRHNEERHLYAPLNSGPGWQVMTPLRIAGESTTGAMYVMVDRGFTPDRLKARETRPEGLLQGQVTVTGRIRLGGTKATFTPDNDPGRNQWFWRDLAAMMSGFGFGNLPFYIEADSAASNPGGWPKPGASDAIFNNLSNRHLEYALTWWALAATLLGVYGFFARSRWPRGSVTALDRLR